MGSPFLHWRSCRLHANTCYGKERLQTVLLQQGTVPVAVPYIESGQRTQGEAAACVRVVRPTDLKMAAACEWCTLESQVREMGEMLFRLEERWKMAIAGWRKEQCVLEWRRAEANQINLELEHQRALELEWYAESQQALTAEAEYQFGARAGESNSSSRSSSISRAVETQTFEWEGYSERLRGQPATAVLL